MARQHRKNNGETKVDMDIGNNTNDLSLAPEVDLIAVTQSEVRIAYQGYVQSQKALLSAFQEQETRAENDYKNTERRYRAYEEIIDKAFKNREIMDNKALELYRKTVENAGIVYRERINQTLQLCKQTTEQAWQYSIRAYKPVQPSPLARLKLAIRSIRDFFIAIAKNIKIKVVLTYQRIESRVRA